MKEAFEKLPVNAARSMFVESLKTGGTVVFSAPTGSGKSTQVPKWLAEMADSDAGQVVVLQPRRMAARMLARRVSEEMGERLGGRVGHQVRFENRCSSETRIRFVTEAILLRQALQDSKLQNVSAVVFDEFHERSLPADLGLAAVRRIQQADRPDLRVVVMSATLRNEAVEQYLPEARFLEAGGRQYPIRIEYCGSALGHQAMPVWERALAAFKRASDEGALEGHVLVFMPGVYEINRTLALFEKSALTRGYALHALHGSLPPERQDAAVASGGGRRIIVSTNVAETSLTIDGVRVVIDGGLARIARFDAGRGVNRLMVEPISQTSADQRAGRAGRTAPGVVYRLWSAAEQASRAADDTPEVHRVDLAESVLLLTQAGCDPLTETSWFDMPDRERIKSAICLLRELGTFDGAQQLTQMGYVMARLPVHPRVARMFVQAGREPEGTVALVAATAALFEQRPIYQRGAPGADTTEQDRKLERGLSEGSDLLVQARALGFAAAARFDRKACVHLGIHAGTARLVWQGALQLADLVARQGIGTGESAESMIWALDQVTPEAREGVGRALLAAFSDHLAMRLDRATRRSRMMDGRVGELRRESVVSAPLWIACEREERVVRGETVVLLGQAHPVSVDALRKMFPGDFREFEGLRYDAETRRVVPVRELMFRELVLERKEGGEVSGTDSLRRSAALLAHEVVEGRLLLKRWDAEADQWIARVNFLARHCPESGIEPIDEEARTLLIEQICEGALGYRDIKDRAVLPVLHSWIAPEQDYYMKEWAPVARMLPRRKRPATIRYTESGTATLAATVQELYDVPGDSLTVANGKVRLLIEILAPNRKMVQLTDDLDGFWERAYPSVRKDLAGRYPKHEWR